MPGLSVIPALFIPTGVKTSVFSQSSFRRRMCSRKAIYGSHTRSCGSTWPPDHACHASPFRRAPPRDRITTFFRRHSSSASARSGSLEFASTPTSLNDRRRSIKWAQDILASPQRYVILDTETTGLGKTAEVIQIALLDPTGRVLFDTFVRPLKRKSIPSDAARVHGITMKILKNAPSYPEIADQLVSLIQHRTVIAYNAECDARLLRQTAERNGGAIPTERWECAMLHYAQFYGEWNDDHGNYRWQKLPGGNHSALGDCQAVLAVLQKMAEG